MKVFEKSKIAIYELEYLDDVIATSEAPGFDDDLNGDWL